MGCATAGRTVSPCEYPDILRAFSDLMREHGHDGAAGRMLEIAAWAEAAVVRAGRETDDRHYRIHRGQALQIVFRLLDRASDRPLIVEDDTAFWSFLWTQVDYWFEAVTRFDRDAVCLRISLGAEQTAAMSPGVYRLGTMMRQDGGLSEIYHAVVEILPAPGDR